MCSIVFIINDSAYERDWKIRMPKEGGDMCMLQMGMDVKYSETEKNEGRSSA